jgi:uncharacterized protein with PIN domain
VAREPKTKKLTKPHCIKCKGELAKVVASYTQPDGGKIHRDEWECPKCKTYYPVDRWQERSEKQEKKDKRDIVKKLAPPPSCPRKTCGGLLVSVLARYKNKDISTLISEWECTSCGRIYRSDPHGKPQLLRGRRAESGK